MKWVKKIMIFWSSTISLAIKIYFNLTLNFQQNCAVIANFKLHGESESRNFSLVNFKEDTVLKTILLGVKQSQPHAQLSLYIDCVSYGNIQTVKTLRDIYMNMRNPQILFVSKQSIMEFFRTS